MPRAHEPNGAFGRTRELYDGMAVVISADYGISEFLEHVLCDLAPSGEARVRQAVKHAHQRLGLTQ